MMFYGILGRRKNKANSKPNKANLRRDYVFNTEGLRLPQSLRSFAMTLVGYLKKQTQFTVGRKWRNVFSERGLWQETSRPNRRKQSQFKPNFVRVSDGFVIACIVTEESWAFLLTWNFV